MDLKEAEAQAREAQIEAALERVRSKAMAMQKSDDLSIAVATIFDELDKLKLGMLRCGIGILNKEKRTADVWTTTISEQGKTVQVSGDESMDIHPLLQGAFNAWLEQTDFSLVLEGEELKKYYKALLGVNFKLPDSESKISETEGLKQYYYVTTFQAGGLFAFRETDFPDESKIVMKRFADVFNLTYTRFQDLQHAEAQAKEAKIETALERVRSRTMAMQRSDELAETAAIVFKQLINLGIEPNRLYIAIIKDEKGNVEFWITDEDGSKVSSGFTANLNKNDSFKKMYEGWKEQIKSITIDMKGKELEEYFQHLGKLNVPFKGGLSQKRRVQNIAYFSQGFIGIASPEIQPEETIDLLERFAAVFNLTYTRFNDLQQAEAQNKIIQAENERKTKELDEARQLQLSMLPKELPNLPNLDIAVYMQTATEVGGDYYDFQVGIDGTLTTIIGDATGHGMKAGTVVTITKSLFNSMASNENILGTFDKISQVIKGMKFRQLAMCLLMMKIRGNRLSMSSAAMPPALIYRAKNKSVEEILLQGMPLGTMKKFPYKKIEGRLNSGDRILLYSDGLPELANDKDQMFGYDRIITEFQMVGEKEPEEIVEHLKNSASQWAYGKEPDDDVTFVVIKIK
jgi:ribosome maturation protein Sdo1